MCISQSVVSLWHRTSGRTEGYMPIDVRVLEFVVRRAPVGARASRDTVTDHRLPTPATSRAVLGEDVTAFRWVGNIFATGDLLGGVYLDIGVISFQRRLNM